MTVGTGKHMPVCNNNISARMAVISYENTKVQTLDLSSLGRVCFLPPMEHSAAVRFKMEIIINVLVMWWQNIAYSVEENLTDQSEVIGSKLAFK